MGELDIREIVDEVLRRKVQLIIIIVLFIILGFAYTINFVKPEFKSTTKVILTNTTIENNSLDFEISNEITNPVTKSDSNLFSTYINLIKSNSLMENVKTNIKIDLNINDLINSVSVNRIENTEMIEISVKNSDSNLASNIANEIATVFSKNIKELYDINAYVVEPAVPSKTPYNSDNVKIEHLKNIVAFMMIGLIIDILYIILVIKIDTKIKSEDDIEKDIDLKVLMSIPAINEKNKKQIELINSNKKTIFSDVFKKLRINIQFTNINHRENKVMLVTSAFSSEGKSFIASNLAISFAQAGKKVILVDTDMRIDRLSKLFNIPSELGLSNYLSNLDTEGMETNQRINSYIKETSIKNLNIITSGSIPPNPSELLESRKISDLIKDLSVFYDLIILDGAPALPVSDSLVLARLANSTLVVCSYNKTKTEELLKVKKDIQSVGGRIVGVVLNKVKLKDYEFNYSTIVEENRKKERKLFGKNILKKKLLDIKERIIAILKSIRKEEVKLLMSNPSSAEVKLNSKKENDIPNYQISEEYIKENINNNSKENGIKNESEHSNLDNKKIEEIKKQEMIEKERLEKEKLEKEKIEKEKQEELEKIKEAEKIAKEEQQKKLAEEKEKLRLEKEEKRKEKAKLANERKEKFNKLKQEKFEKFIEFKNEKTEKASIFLKEKSSIAKEKIKEGLKKLREKTNKTKENLKEKISELIQKQKEKSALKKEQNEIERQKLEELRKQDAIEREKENKILEEIREKERIENEKKQEELAKIKEAEMIAKREQEQKLAEEREKLRQEKEKIRYEEKIRRQALRAELRNKRMHEKEEKRKEREERRLKQKEEARIKEEILEDNLYPKTKYNKNL